MTKPLSLLATLAILFTAPAAAHAWGGPVGAAGPPPAPQVAPLDWGRRVCDAVMKRSPVLTDR